MNIDGIIAVSGKPGLYKVIGQTKNGVIVTSLSDGKKLAMSSSSKMSALQDIAIYTYTEEIPLVAILDKIRIKEEGKAAIGHKSSAAVLSDYFRIILDDYDEDRVYPSDIKKVISWYNTLQREGLAVESIEETEEVVEEKKAVKKPKAKAKTVPKAKPKTAAKPKTIAKSSKK